MRYIRAWQPYLRPGALVIFDDYTHPDFTGIKQAIEELALDGEQRGTLFIHQNHCKQIASHQDKQPPEAYSL
jgi:hypothetical protein